MCSAPLSNTPHPSPHLTAPQVPYRLLKAFHKVQQRLVRELEKKFSGKDVVVIANRRILPPSSSGVSNARPRSRTLTAVHEAILGDLVYPTEIVGKRIRYRVDGSKLMKVRGRFIWGARQRQWWKGGGVKRGGPPRRVRLCSAQQPRPLHARRGPSVRQPCSQGLCAMAPG